MEEVLGVVHKLDILQGKMSLFMSIPLLIFNYNSVQQSVNLLRGIDSIHCPSHSPRNMGSNGLDGPAIQIIKFCITHEE